jgi:hypothetical protein
MDANQIIALVLILVVVAILFILNIFAKAYGSLVFSKEPVNRYSSFIGCLQLPGYTQLDPKNIIFFINKIMIYGKMEGAL